MNKLISSEELVDLISKQGDFNKEFVGIFLKDFVSIIEESLILGEEVKIDGIGEFKISNTQGGEKRNIIFISDESLRKEINSPFEQFEPVVMNHSDISSCANLSNNKAEDFVELETTNFNNTTMDTNKKNSEVEDSNKNKPGFINNTEVNKEISEHSQDAKDPDQEILTVAQPQKEPAAESAAKPEGSETADTKQTNEDTACDIIDGETKAECNDFVKKTNKSAILIIAILIGIAIVSFLIYFIVVVNKNDKSPNIQDVNEKLEQIQKDNSKETVPAEEVVAPKDTNVSQNKPDESNKNLDVAKKETASQNSVYPELLKIPNKPVILAPGQRLTLLALRYYGDKSFWVYIYDANKSKYPNPENIPAGAELIIPQMAKYNIDYKNPKSIREAKNKAAKILEEF